MKEHVTNSHLKETNYSIHILILYLSNHQVKFLNNSDDEILYVPIVAMNYIKE